MRMAGSEPPRHGQLDGRRARGLQGLAACGESARHAMPAWTKRRLLDQTGCGPRSLARAGGYTPPEPPAEDADTQQPSPVAEGVAEAKRQMVELRSAEAAGRQLQGWAGDAAHGGGGAASRTPDADAPATTIELRLPHPRARRVAGRRHPTGRAPGRAGPSPRHGVVRRRGRAGGPSVFLIKLVFIVENIS